MAENPAAEVRLEKVSYRYPGSERSERPVIAELSLELPRGVMTLVGPNGSGKSTLLLLAAGILLPTSGTVFLRGIDTRSLREEHERQRHVSFVYQNMEFETEEPIGALLEYVYANGFHEPGDVDLIPELIEVCELSALLGKKTQEVSKGELQRTIIAFSLLYGSRILMLDEPIFALEERQKHRIMAFLVEYTRTRGISLYYSVHELDISWKYSDTLLLFYKSGRLRMGSTDALFSRTNIEEAYQVPYVMLKHKESLYRETLDRKIDKYGL